MFLYFSIIIYISSQLIEAAEKEASGQNGSTWTGWAVSSLTSRFYKEQQAGEKQSEVTPNATQQKGAENTAKQNGTIMISL